MENCDGKVINMKCLGCEFLPLCLEEKVFAPDLEVEQELLIMSSCPKSEKDGSLTVCSCCD